MKEIESKKNVQMAEYRYAVVVTKREGKNGSQISGFSNRGLRYL